jgi:hypothetical protein
MKKLIAITALVAATSAMADSVTAEYQAVDVKGGAEQNLFLLGYKRDITKTFAADVSMSNTVTEGTNTVGARYEAGVTGTYDLVGPVKFYTRAALGEKTASGSQFTYYVIEPGVQVPLTGSLTAKLGWRYRSAVDSANGDQTHTTRVGVAYALSKTDSIGVRYDRMRGDAEQNSVAVNYTRSF